MPSNNSQSTIQSSSLRKNERDIFETVDDGTIFLQMVSFYSGRMEGCRVIDPLGYVVGCCCDHSGCCGAWDED